MVHVPNPVVPLRFERSSWGGFDYIGTEAHGLQVSFAADYVSPAVFTAHLTALSAYSAPTWQVRLLLPSNRPCRVCTHRLT